jgi:hypothetical protein
MSAQWSTARLSADRFVLAATSLDKQQLALFAGGYQSPGAVIFFALLDTVSICSAHSFQHGQKVYFPMWWTFTIATVQAHGQRHGSVWDVKIWQLHL